MITEFLIEAINYCEQEEVFELEKNHQTVKKAIKYIRDNYNNKIQIEDIARHTAINKFALCRIFKKITGQTIIENINRYRVMKATDYLEQGYSVSETAILCGFENLSFFTQTFKRYTSKLPSQVKKSLR